MPVDCTRGTVLVISKFVRECTKFKANTGTDLTYRSEPSEQWCYPGKPTRKVWSNDDSLTLSPAFAGRSMNTLA